MRPNLSLNLGDLEIQLVDGALLTMGGGFYFTSAYNVRIVQLRDYDGGSNLGKKRSYEQKREILFGIAHYAK